MLIRSFFGILTLGAMPSNVFRAGINLDGSVKRNHFTCARLQQYPIKRPSHSYFVNRLVMLTGLLTTVGTFDKLIFTKD